MLPTDLVCDVDLLCLDAGGTVVFFDPEAAARAAQAAGFAADPEAFARAEAEMKRAVGRADGVFVPVDDPKVPRTWGALVRFLVEHAGVTDSVACVQALWEVHREFNLWRRVPAGLVKALEAVRAAGILVCVVSNSEGRLEELFRRLEIFHAFDAIVDSHYVGVEKPDPRIFAHAVGRFGIAPERALHVGDVYGADIVGARSAGIRAVLVDPRGDFDGLYPNVARTPSVADTVNDLLRTRGAR